ncbi:hypothetical protein NOJ28_10875 [Neorhizobium galegae]|uniref:hypothetical protein n=1 Tax=Neorhizobium galegae TaxID=399 RepID=UPI000621F06E|nr:hypothetical protein [Neorhizobium galegae]MCQ1766038.1 hypothetical protein [Neorhizobium galegae]MCQ1844952.1 hypothetical protein [Neorhizobium galegae]CDZ40439.1 Hypothetical protein NGAL_HAMBI1146_38720 [Neorhizobium galegae bv. officinalis]
MADFVAVIRRAVDGLANNTPEMRAKVYDKARGAVQRQLENMKPRPPEDMLRRQLDKLEAAIVDVESEHAEALEPIADGASAADAQTVDEAAPAERVSEYEDDQQRAAEPAQAPEAHEPAEMPAASESAPAVRVERPVFYEDGYEEPVPAVAPAEPEPVAQEPADVEPPVSEPAVLHEEEEVTAVSDQPEPAHQPEPAQQYGDWRDDVPSEEPPVEPATYDHSEQVPEPSQAFDESTIEFPTAAPLPASEPVVPEPVNAAAEPVDTAESESTDDDFPYPTRGEQTVQQDAPEFVEAWRHSEPDPFEDPHPVEDRMEVEQPAQAYQAPEPAKPADEDWGWEVPAPAEPPMSSQETVAAAAWNDVPELITAGPVVPIDHGHGGTAAPADAHFDPETHVSADSVRMPPVADLPELAEQSGAAAGVATAAGIDPFAEYLDQQQSKKVTAAPAKPADSDPWGDLEELIGFNKDAPSSSGGGAHSTLHTDADADDLMHAPARPYRVTPVRKRNYAGIVLAIVGLALVGGGGYAIWLNRDSLNDMVDGLIQSSLPGSQSAQQTPAPAPATPQPNPTPSTPSNPSTPPQNGAANTPAAPRTADGSTAGTKFTQRLMADGREVDEGPGVTAGLAQNAEGQSVAQLNAPPANPPTAAPGAPAAAPRAPNGSANAAPAQTPPAVPAPNAATPPASPPSAAPANAPAVAGEKMFLYEERIGQTAPTAIDGSVSWSLQREAGANGRQEPVVQGRINVPGRGLTALMTFKRNTDPSLPASHLVEIVFAVPPDFEGGAIESVQRIAMKASEQDRGNALIAVPAKITDDFHMIALNDFPDARSTNLELLRSRNWIDIPIAYRNGRRALLTLQKGPEGERAFNDAIREWATLGATVSGQ